MARPPAPLQDSIKSFIRTVPDYPHEGILFRDITGLLENARGLRLAVDSLAERYAGKGIDLVAGIEARGFIFGTAVAYKLGVGFIPIRKAGKLPGEVVGVDYQLEYGTDRMEMHADAVSQGDDVLLVDDLIATGGTAQAAIRLLERAGAVIVGCSFIIDLPDLGGAKALNKGDYSVHTLMDFAGH